MNEGWGACLNTTKWHYFIDGRSLCKRFMLFGRVDLEQGNDASPDNCRACMKKLAKHKAKVDSNG